MVDWDTSRVKSEMLEVARALPILPSSGWDLLDPKALEPTPRESHVISFIPFHLAGFGVPMHPFVGRFLHYFML